MFLKILIYLFIFREKGRRKRGRETSMCERYIDQLPLGRPQPGIWATTQACVLTGNPTGNILVCRPGTQSTEPHQPGQPIESVSIICVNSCPNSSLSPTPVASAGFAPVPVNILLPGHAADHICYLLSSMLLSSVSVPSEYKPVQKRNENPLLCTRVLLTATLSHSFLS